MVSLVKNFAPLDQPAGRARFVRRTPARKQTNTPNFPLRYKRARYYHAQLGRFISRDPLGYVDGMSLYRANFVPGAMDPDGTVVWKANNTRRIFRFTFVDFQVHTVKTDAGNEITAYRPFDNDEDRDDNYWCHGFTFGGSIAEDGPFSIGGGDVFTVLKDDGWKVIPCCLAEPNEDILVYYKKRTSSPSNLAPSKHPLSRRRIGEDLVYKITHSGIVLTNPWNNGKPDETVSTLRSKRGVIGSLGNTPWDFFLLLGKYSCYTQGEKAESGLCCQKGDNER